MEEIKKLELEALQCRRCKLAEGRTNVVFGVGNPSAELMFIGEAPGYNEDIQGEPFVGAAGKLLDKVILEQTGYTRKEIYITNVVKCRPPNNRDPETDEIIACNPFLSKQIELIKPLVICTLGNFATKTILDSKEGISRLRGSVFSKFGAKIIPTYHPAAILRNMNLLPNFERDIKKAFELLDEIKKGKNPVIQRGDELEQPTLF